MRKQCSITKEDILQLASSLNISLNDSEVQQVMDIFPSEQESDPTGTWDLIAEHCIHQIKNI